MIFRRLIVYLALLLLCVTSARAQFDEQRVWGGTASGTNTLTLTIPNMSAYLPGVPIRFIVANNNTGAVTLNINSIGAVAINKVASTGIAALVGNSTGYGSELVANQIAEVAYDGSVFQLRGQAGRFTGSTTLAPSTVSFNLINVGLSASVGSNALTVSLLNSAAGTPATTGPVLIPFRDATIATGDAVLVAVTGSLSIVISSTNTMGCVSAQMCRLWVFAINNSGTVALCAYNAFDGTSSVIGLNEQALQTSASGTTGGSSAQTLYCSTSAVTSMPIRYLGYIDIQEATAGTWASGPTYVQLMGPGIKKPGDIVQAKSVSSTTSASTNSASFAALTSTQTLSVTPTSAANPIMVKSFGTMGMGGAVNGEIQLARGTTLIGNPVSLNATAAINAPAAIFALDVPNTTSSTTYSFYGKCTSSCTVTYPPATTGVVLILEEIMGALEPANDNTEMRMVG